MESRAGAARARWIVVAGAVFTLLATGMAPGLQAQTEASAEIPPAQELRLLEARLLDATRVRFEYEITAEGAMTAQLDGEVVLRDGRRLLVRPFTENDVDSLYEFFLHLPQEVRRFAWDRIDNRALIESWGRDLDYHFNLHLLPVCKDCRTDPVKIRSGWGGQRIGSPVNCFSCSAEMPLSLRVLG